jgi:hypothetical protein
LQHYHSKLKQDYRRQIRTVHANGIEADAATEDETDVTPAPSIESGMIPIESVLLFVRDTTNDVATTSQQTDIYQRIRTAYRVRNAWHNESTNVLQAILAKELQLFNWDLIDHERAHTNEQAWNTPAE